MIIKFNNKLFELIIKFCKKKKNFLNDSRSRNKQVAYHVRRYGKMESESDSATTSKNKS